ncbi:hypothetical protein [Laspinema palackyanum]|uniref:hypothetical protein n=1 Tax=Laspinema palackyanum TaxID=3231601 RepID=UPI00345DA497|nr:hypothetical protein [Laspinema sp. D2c]
MKPSSPISDGDRLNPIHSGFYENLSPERKQAIAHHPVSLFWMGRFTPPTPDESDPLFYARERTISRIALGLDCS